METTESSRESYTEAAPGGTSSPLFTQVLEILLDPTGCWPRLRQESSTIDDVYRSFLIPLAAIGPICGFIGGLIGYGRFLSGILLAVLMYFVTLGLVYVFAIVIEKMTGVLDGSVTRTNAFKTVAYAGTPSYIAGVFQLIPSSLLAGLGVLISLYGLFLYVVGLPQMVDIVPEKKWILVGVTLGANAVVGLCLGSVVAAIVS